MHVGERVSEWVREIICNVIEWERKKACAYDRDRERKNKGKRGCVSLYEW